MPLIYRGSWDEAEWAVWKIAESEEQLWDLSRLSAEEAAHIGQITHERRRKESLAARAARAMLSSSGFYSLSHSYPWAAAISAPYPVAIDIERLRPFPAGVCEYFMHPSEKERFMNENISIWKVWCSKEVAYKILSSKFDSLSFRHDLLFLGERVVSMKSGGSCEIGLAFFHGEGWLMAVGRVESPEKS
ncbi:MAG: 4'-phosphopantetheinyl transferase superfamily protein [Bacteroidia bacterium]|nr:4'-phosphopantetheinyl transferase superfamily protein [Bacteroidia bacterium]